jgi:membrane protein DedA with SNARE-associated domain/rhodanese-related sulfurtransferase
MDYLFTALERHGYLVLCLSVFLETTGFPIPAAIALLFAGGASARHVVNGPLILTGGLITMLAGDTLMFLLGRSTGWWLLSLLCRVSMNPESCILRSADSFHKRGRTLLLFAKFLPGLNSMAAPMAGSMNMRFGQFLRLDAGGVALYIGLYWTLGFLFSGAVRAIADLFQAFGRVAEMVLIALVAGYLIYLVIQSIRGGALRAIPRVNPLEAAHAMSAEGALVYDVRSHGYYSGNATRIRGSLRLDPNALHQPGAQPGLPADKIIYVYCTCAGEATSLRVAKELIDNGFQVAVIRGGLRGWRRAGLPVETVPRNELAEMPVFEN